MKDKAVTIEETPDSNKGLHTTQPVPREKANVEAEVGETMVTSDDATNTKKLVAIGGKPHSEGGTPLDLPEGTAIYSDKIKIKDPLILKFFNESGKKPKTFAQISKKYDTNKLHKELENEDNDKITNDSLEKSIDDANFKLSALFMIQEFHEKKGSPEEHSKHFEPFMERMGVSYDTLFGSTEENPEPGLLSRKKGGIVKGELPKAHSGGNIEYHAHPHGWGVDTDYKPKQAYLREGLLSLNQTLEKLKLEPLPEDKFNDRNAISAKIVEMQSKSAEMPKIVVDYMLNWKGEDKSHRPNNALQKELKRQGFEPKNGTDFTNVELQQFYKDGSISDDFIVKGFQDGLWHYRAPWSHITDVTDKEKYSELDKFVHDNGFEASDGNWYVHKGRGEYEAYRYNPDGSIEKIEPNEKIVDEAYKWNLRHMQDRPDERNMDYRWDHRRAYQQAVKNKFRIPRLRPFTPIEEAQYVDQAYYNPDQVIASMQSMVSDMGTKQAMFAPQQAQLANFLAGQQFDTIAKAIGQYEDKNVAAYNREQTLNTEIANRANQRLAEAIEGHHDKTTILKQEYANAITNADNNIAENEIAMWNERRNRLNLEATIGEQFATDPDTGLHEFQVGKDFFPSQGAEKSIADTWSELRQQLPEASESEITDMAMAMHSGKYEVRRNNTNSRETQYRF